MYVCSRQCVVFVSGVIYICIALNDSIHALYPSCDCSPILLTYIKFATLISDLLVEETGENQRAVASHRQTLSLSFLTCKL